jgi:ketosteroid isomerase-like protein
MDAPEVAVVRAWHDALNAGDADRLVALSSEDVEVGGPRGAGTGGPLLREWVERAGIRMHIRRLFHRAGAVVAEERAEWLSAGSGAATGGQDVATVFRIRDGRVAAAIRHDDLASALRAADVDEADAVEQV